MKIKTSELVGAHLDVAVAMCEPYEKVSRGRLGSVYCWDNWGRPIDFAPSTDWSIGGPILHREKIATETEHGDPWRARFGRARITFDGRAHHYHHAEGPTPLIAAMRCFVASKLGDEVDIPEELL